MADIPQEGAVARGLTWLLGSNWRQEISVACGYIQALRARWPAHAAIRWQTRESRCAVVGAALAAIMGWATDH